MCTVERRCGVRRLLNGAVPRCGEGRSEANIYSLTSTDSARSALGWSVSVPHRSTPPVDRQPGSGYNETSYAHSWSGLREAREDVDRSPAASQALSESIGTAPCRRISTHTTVVRTSSPFPRLPDPYGYDRSVPSSLCVSRRDEHCAPPWGLHALVAPGRFGRASAVSSRQSRRSVLLAARPRNARPACAKPDSVRACLFSHLHFGRPANDESGHDPQRPERESIGAHHAFDNRLLRQRRQSRTGLPGHDSPAAPDGLYLRGGRAGRPSGWGGGKFCCAVARRRTGPPTDRRDCYDHDRVDPGHLLSQHRPCAVRRPSERASGAGHARSLLSLSRRPSAPDGPS